MIILIESVAMCILFHFMLLLVTGKRQEVFVNDYPPIVTHQLRNAGLIAQKPPTKVSDILRKVTAIIIFSLLFALLLRNVNGIKTFWEGAITAYGLWLVVDWYDFFVIDVLCASFDKFYQAAGVSGFEKSSVIFHFKGSLRGMLIGLAFAPMVGFLITL